MTSLTLVTLAVIVYGIVNARGYGRALALGGATPVGAALVVGGTAVPTFYAVAIGAAFGLVARLLARTRRRERLADPPAPGVLLLVAFAAWGAFVTLLAPYLFSGLEVLGPLGSRRLDPGVLTQSNLAQTIYLVLGVCVVVFLSRSRWAGPEIIGITVGVPVLLSLWAYLGTFGVPFPVGFFDNSPNFAYIAQAAGGIERFRGILSEPSGLGGTCLIAIAYMISRASQVDGPRRAGCLAVVVIAAVLGFVSTSASFVVAGVVVIALAAVAAGARIVLRRGRLNRLPFALVWAASIAAFWFLPVLVNLFEQVVDDKVASTSYTDRSGADTYSYGLVLDTFGFGVGLGGNRPSSFVATLLSTVGIIGTVLFIAVVWTLVREGYAVARYRPVVWALAAMLVGKAIAGPDLNDTNGLTWLCLGVLAHAALTARRARGTAGATRATIPAAPGRPGGGGAPASGPVPAAGPVPAVRSQV